MAVLIIDPDVAGSRFLGFVLKSDGHQTIHTARSAREALAQLGAAQFSLIITELDLSDADGAALCAAIRSRQYHGPLLVLTEQSSTEDRIRAFEAGADDVMHKPVDPTEFLARIAAVSSRFHHYDGKGLRRPLRVGDAELSVSDLRLCLDGHDPVSLTPTEMRLIESLMRHPDVAISRETLVNRTWGFELIGESNRLDVYIRRLRRKIEPDPTAPCYLVTVRSIGYAFRSHPRSRPEPTAGAAEPEEVTRVDDPAHADARDLLQSAGHGPDISYLPDGPDLAACAG